MDILKGVPEGSILGPTIFNIFINDIFSFVQKSKLFNFADNNTVAFTHGVFETLINTLQNDSIPLINWFTVNKMKANPDKLPENSAKLLGVEIDSLLNFNKHISLICKKASSQMNALTRIGNNLTLKSSKAIFHAFIMSDFNFCPRISDFCGKQYSDKLELLQYRVCVL